MYGKELFFAYIYISVIIGGIINTNTAAGYSIWLIPSEPQFSYLKSTIDIIAKEVNAPTFLPHITLLGQLDQRINHLQNELTKISQVFTAFDLELDRISTLDQYFRSIFFNVISSQNLIQLWHHAIVRLQVEKDLYEPHLSLLYSHLNNTEKERLLKSYKVDLPLSITIDEIVLMKTKGSPEQWQVVDRYPLFAKQN